MKKWTIIAIVCMAVGAITVGVAGAAVGFNFVASAEKQQKNTVTGEFTGVRIGASSDDVYILPSTDGSARVEWTNGDVEYDIGVSDGILCIERAEGDLLSGLMNMGGNDLRVLLPEKEYASLEISLSSGNVDTDATIAFGNVRIEGSSGEIELDSPAKTASVTTASGDIEVEANVDDLTLRATSGDISVESCAGTSLTAGTTSGGVELKDVVSDRIDIKTTSGGVKLENCDGDAITVGTTSGSVTGSLRTGKIFNTKTTSGDVDLPRSVEGHGSCDITTTSGDIRFK